MSQSLRRMALEMQRPDEGRQLRPCIRPASPPGPFLVAGLGRAGRAAIHALLGFAGADRITGWDRDTTRRTRRVQRELAAHRVRTLLGSDMPILDGPAAPRTVVKSPGVDPKAPLIVQARARGVEVLDELELGWRLSRAPMLAVTGTNGKSTVAGLAAALLTAGGFRTQLAGNTDFGLPLSAAATKPLDWTVCEVSSFQLEGCPFLVPDVAVFTNLTPEHLVRHRSMRRYGEIKRRLFVRGQESVAHAVIDVDDPFGRTLASDVDRRGGSVVRVGFSSGADYQLLGAGWDLRGGTIRVATPSGELELETRLPGSYNARNVGAALAIADLFGLERSLAVSTIATCPGPFGRFEHVDGGQDYDVLVDFAHTPDGVEQFLVGVRAGMGPKGRLIAVLGLDGRPDPPKQRAMGARARSLSDILILTTSSFREGSRLRSLQALLQGARTELGGAQLAVAVDRTQAIETALGAAAPGDVVVILGRGALAEMTLDAHGTTRQFEDAKVAREILASALPPADARRAIAVL